MAKTLKARLAKRPVMKWVLTISFIVLFISAASVLVNVRSGLNYLKFKDQPTVAVIVQDCFHFTGRRSYTECYVTQEDSIRVDTIVTDYAGYPKETEIKVRKNAQNELYVDERLSEHEARSMLLSLPFLVVSFVTFLGVRYTVRDKTKNS